MNLSRIVICAMAMFAARVLAAAPPTTQPGNSANVTSDARQVLDEASTAYAKLKSLNLTGTVSVELKIQGEQPQTHSIPFTATFAAPNRFRHESKGDVLLGSTGAKLYTYKSDKNAYTLADAPKDRVPANDLPHDLASVLGSQNPSLLLALSKNAGNELTDDVEDAAKVEDTIVGDSSYPTLKFKLTNQSTMIVAFDPQTHLLRQSKTDLSSPLKKRRPDLASVVVTTDYTQVRVDEPSKDEVFAWSPPAGAIDADAAAAAHPLDTVAAASLEGKAAPAFKLPGMDGKTVSLASLKGHVVVIDFWATWCGPCRLSLPHLDKMYQAQKDSGVEVFAIDQQEDLKDVEEFVKQTKLGVPVLLDRDGKVGEAYGVEGIPQTVVIGKDGKVNKVFIGFNPAGSPGDLQKAVDSAKKQ